MGKQATRRLKASDDEPDLPWFYGYLNLVGATILVVGIGTVLAGAVALVLFARKLLERPDSEGLVTVYILGGAVGLFLLLNLTLLTAGTWFLATDIGESLQHIKLYSWRLRQAAHRMEEEDVR